jgi:AraC family transcriptional regulator
MDPVQKALWFVESHSRAPASLEEIANACYVSPFHITRAFAATMGLSLMRYVRARRLSEAARRLAEGADDILGVALDVGYGSHEAFTRAFREQFALTPEQVRAQGHLNNVSIMEPIAMKTAPLPELDAPRFETLKPTLLAGLVERYNCQAPAGIPDQWQRFSPYLGAVPTQVGRAAYGASYNFDGESNFDYLCGVEIRDASVLSKGLKSLPLPAQKYVVFTHSGHVAGIRGTLTAIWSNWFPASGYEPVEAPTLERYGPEFNPTTGMGGFEIWIPVKN